MNLYQLTDYFVQSLESSFDPDTGEALPAFEEKRAMWGSKARDVLAYSLNLKSDAKQLDELLKSIKARRDAIENKRTRLVDYLRDNMKFSGITELKANDGSFTAKLLIERDESIEIDEGTAFPPELCNAPAPPSPSKSLIRAAILRGEAIAGARIVRKDRLEIK